MDSNNLQGKYRNRKHPYPKFMNDMYQRDIKLLVSLILYQQGRSNQLDMDLTTDCSNQQVS